MKHVIKKSDSTPIKIYALTKSEFEKKLPKCSGYLQGIAKVKYKKIKNGNFYIDRNTEGTVLGVYKVVPSEINIWSFSAMIKKLPEADYIIDADLNEFEATQVAIGWECAFYNYEEYKTSKSTAKKIRLIAPDNCNYSEAARISKSMILTRDLINAPPCDLGPYEFAAKAEEIAKANKAKFKVIKDQKLIKEGYEAIYAVGKASEKRPCLVDFTWGNEKHPKVTLVGKGITFDTGGLNMKGGGSMRMMKKDMGGAAIVLGLAQTIMEAKLPVRLRVLLPLAENHISDNAYRPSDIIKTKAGVTVEIDNTDAEGRVVLCEPLNEADSEQPDLLIDVATLTGAARVAVGAEISAFFCQSEGLSEDFYKSGRKVHDPTWRLPLWQPYEYMLESEFADTVNSATGGYGGAITAALYLKKFVTETRNWIHVDTNAWNVRSLAGRPIGGEAMGMRALYDLIKERFI